MGGVRAFLNLGAEREFLKEKNEDEFSAAINLQVQDDTHVGASWEHEEGETTKLNVQAVYTGLEKVDAWVRADTKNQWVSTGCSKDEGNRFNHTYEAVFGYGEHSKVAGIMGSPAWLRFGAKYNMSDASSLVSNYLIASHFEKNSHWKHAIDKNWTVGVNYHFDSRRQGAANRSSHEFGYSLGY